MRRTPLKRRTPLRAKYKSVPHADQKLAALGVRTLTDFPSEGKLIARAARRATKHARRERAESRWFVWVKSQPCFVLALARFDVIIDVLDANPSFITPCTGGIDADHMGSKMRDGGDGEMAADRTCVSICHGHHMERHDFTGTFKGFNQERMRTFLTAGVAWMHMRAQQQGVEIPDV